MPKGLNQYCWQKGFDHTFNTSLTPDVVSESFEVAPCTLNDAAAKAYGDGVVAAMNPHVEKAFGIGEQKK